MSDIFEMPPRQALLRMVVPISIGFVMLMVIDFADVAVAKYLPGDALAVMGYCYPVIYFMMAIGIGLNQGLTIVASADALKYGEARLYEWFVQSVYFAILMSVILILMSVAVLYFEWIDQEFMYLITDIKSFLGMILCAICPMFILLILCAVSQIRGKPEAIRDVLAIMLLLTIALHPFCALFLDLGIVGIAMSKSLVALLGVFFLFYRLVDFSIMKTVSWRFNWHKSVLLSRQALPASCIQLLVPVYLLMLTKVITAYGVTAVAGFGLGYRVIMFVIIPILGVLVALLVLLSHAYADGEKDRIRLLLSTSIKWGCGIVVLAVVVSYYVFRWFFSPIGEIEQIALDYIVLAMYITVLEYIIGILIVSLQSIQRPKWAFVTALSRTLIFPIPILGYIYTQGVNEVTLTDLWHALAVSFSLALLVSYMVWRMIFWPKVHTSRA